MARKRLALNEKSKGLWHNIHAKRKRGEKMNPKGHPDAPSSKEMKMAQEAIQRRMDRMVIIATDPATGRKVIKIAPKKEIDIGKGKQESVQVDELAPLVPAAIGAARALGMAGRAFKAARKAYKTKGLGVGKSKYTALGRAARDGGKVLQKGYQGGKKAAMSSNPVVRDAAGRSARAGLVKAPLIPYKAATRGTDFAWKKLGKTPRHTQNTARRAKKGDNNPYQHDPSGHRIKNLVAKPMAVSTAYGQDPVYAHKQAFRVATGKKIQAPKVPFTKSNAQKTADKNEKFKIALRKQG